MIRKQFTGYERDNETDLDFAQARMYANRLGRFTTVDPIFISPERLLDPQRVNLYIYSRNNPLKFVDSTGEDIVLAEGMTEKQLNQLVDAMYAAYKTVQGKEFFDGEAAAETTLTLAVGPVSDIDNAAYGDTTIDGNDNITITLDLEKRESLKAAGTGNLGNRDRGSVFSRERQEGVTIAVPEKLENTGKHEVSHGIDARKNPEQFRRDVEKENREKTPAKDRATEQRRAGIQEKLGNRDIKNKGEDLKNFKKLIGYDNYKVKAEERKKD